MKKITAIILTALLLISSSICVSAKAYEFVGNQVLFSLTKEASERVYNGELVINSTPDVGTKAVILIPKHQK